MSLQVRTDGTSAAKGHSAGTLTYLQWGAVSSVQPSAPSTHIMLSISQSQRIAPETALQDPVLTRDWAAILQSLLLYFSWLYKEFLQEESGGGAVTVSMRRTWPPCILHTLLASLASSEGIYPLSWKAHRAPAGCWESPPSPAPTDCLCNPPAPGYDYPSSSATPCASLTPAPPPCESGDCRGRTPQKDSVPVVRAVGGTPPALRLSFPVVLSYQTMKTLYWSVVLERGFPPGRDWWTHSL